MDFLKKVNFKTLFPLLGLIGVVLFFQIITGGKVFQTKNIMAVINSSFFILIATVAFSFIMSVGNLDLSMGTVMAVSCTCAAVVAKISPFLALPVAILVGGIFGAFNGFVHADMKLGSLIATMTTQSIFSGILVLILDGGTLSAPKYMLSWNTMSLKITAMLIIVLIGIYLFNFTAYGKQCRAVGSCAEAARLCGVSVRRVKYMTFINMGFAMGALGFFSLIRTGTASATTGSDLMMNVWCAALLGGLPLSGGSAAKFRSVLIGSFTMAFLANGMTLMGLLSRDKQLIQGIVFLIAVAISFDRKHMVVIK
ncbi:MAG TPA: ABC transporter permease [Clostridiales bacterium]|nr:ABC transporter permease [Clostridiales bacterium]